jgi:hypothetical protein
VQTHDVTRGIVQDGIDELERYDAREAPGVILKQLAQVSMHRKCFGYLQQGPVRLAGEKCLCVSWQSGHDEMLRGATHPRERDSPPRQPGSQERAAPGLFYQAPQVAFLLLLPLAPRVFERRASTCCLQQVLLYHA